MPAILDSNTQTDHHHHAHGAVGGHNKRSYDNMDLVESLLAEIENGEYLCLVCADDITPSSEIWSCDVCYRVYHLSCIRTWAEKSLSYDDSSSSTTGSRSWKCPSCSTFVSAVPSDYRCWCKKEINPPYDGIAPHSCGQTCAVSLPTCPHKCMGICHPGPHPECAALGPPIRCFCMKKSKQLPCVLTNYKGWQCDNICGETLPCGIHTCKKRCHRGLCGDCTESVNAACYCGSTKITIPCYSVEPKESTEIIDAETGEKKSWVGFFVCDKVSKGLYDCGVHEYQLECEKRTKETFQCPKQPKNDEACPCGKSKVIDLLGHPRSTCTEAIPTCGQVCGKKLKCGHTCSDFCHEGDCSPCYYITEMRCRCSNNRFLVPCKFLEAGLKPICTRRCTGMLHCRRHRCTEVCCEFEKKANKHGKAATWGKGYNKHSPVYDEYVEKEYAVKHKCDKPCNTVLNCGKHVCQKTCHVEPCGPCLESSLDDVSCSCGRTVLRAPVRCGTMMPTCPYPCTRPYSCGHSPATTHPCHPDDVPCDSCRKLVTKPCACGKNPAVANVPCYKETASCGQLCGKIMTCGHPCSKMCHAPAKPGEPSTCETKCLRICRRELPCGHLHVTARCHYPKPCSQVKPLGNNPKCKEVHILGCKCGEITKTVPCKGLVEDRDMSLLIPCDEGCLDAARRRQLADAFGMELKTQTDGFKYTDNIVDLYLSNPGWSTGIEKKIRQFAMSHVAEENGNSTGDSTPPEKALKFPPMKSLERMFIHELAGAYSLRSQSYDPEPQRNVVVFVRGAPNANFGVTTGDLPNKSVSSESIYVPQLTIGQYISENHLA